MISDDFGYLLEDFLSAGDGTNSDNRYVLRKMLSRGISEAYYRYRATEGHKAAYYKSQSFQLEDILDDLDDMMDDDGLPLSEHRPTIMRAIKLCQCLLAVDQAETNGDYNRLIDYITEGLCEDCRDELLAA